MPKPHFLCSGGNENWTTDLSSVPSVSEVAIRDYYDGKSGSSRQLQKSYNFAAESYVDCSTIMTNTADIRSGKVYVRGKCYRSQSKNGTPYVTCLVLCPSTGLVADSWCQCPAGVAGACSHAMALLRTVSLLKMHGFDESPPELACTELPQRWRRPRQAAMRAASIQDIDWRKPREGGKETPTWSRLFDPRREDDREESMNSDVKSLAECLVRKGHQFAIVLQEGSKLPFSETKFGEALQGSPATYQQSRKPAQLEVWRSQNIEIVTEMCDPDVPTRINLFEDAVAEYRLPPLLDKCQADILKEIVLTSEDARALEQNTRQQASSKRWLSARKLRLTASQFGNVLHRSQWTEKGLNNLTAQRDLSKALWWIQAALGWVPHQIDSCMTPQRLNLMVCLRSSVRIH
ncbi:uncharacterized protein LOC135393948 [Ornithodoros turicata]|uniref:uncharacterized protein LOC135393948 n=1 Tax=Ornithodoros turicata TaxID=34597 RepID=UPI003138EF5C